MKKRAVILLSGGLDSATTLFYARHRGYETHALIFDYGQRHRREVRQAVRIAREAESRYRVLKIRFPWKGSALLDPSVKMPRDRKTFAMDIPVTYVPARNMIFLSYAASFAETVGAGAIFIGANAIDYSGYPDCRPDFFRAFEQMLRRGLKTGVEGQPIKIVTPLIRKTKSQIIRMGLRMNVPYHLTWSCYQGGLKPCGRCDSCLLREKGFSALVKPDPARTGRSFQKKS